jgi:hypothetical protein
VPAPVVPSCGGTAACTKPWQRHLLGGLAATCFTVLEVTVNSETATVEMAPVWTKRRDRGVVSEGPVGARPGTVATIPLRGPLLALAARTLTWLPPWVNPFDSAAIRTQPGGCSILSGSSQPGRGVATSWARAKCGTRTRSCRGY